MNRAIKFCVFELVKVSNFSLNGNFWLVQPNLLKNGNSHKKQKNWTLKPELDSCHWILHILISSGTKFHNKPTFLIFLTKFTQKWYLLSKSEKVNLTTEFCIFKLEESNYIFLAGGNALVNLVPMEPIPVEPMHKNVLQRLLGATHLVRHLMTDAKICR